MSVAPFIKPIRLQGGTFYTFSSASEDLGFSFNNDEKKFRFSNYVLLNIPDIRRPTGGENFIQFDAIPGAFLIDGSKSLNAYLAESFQNYALNLETMIISSNDYDPEEKRSVAERVFFKWLKEIGGIRFREVKNTEVSDPSFGLRFVEEDPSDRYTRVVKYIGEIDIVNNVKNKENAYSEVYIHLPTSHGAQPTILFTSIEDANYHANAEFTNTPVDPLNQPYIYGRKYTDSHPAGLDFRSHYDSKFSSYQAEAPFSQPNANFYSWDEVSSTWVQDGFPGFYWWYPTPKANTFFLEKTYFTDSRNDKFRLFNGTKSVEFIRSRLDGISIEFNEKVYKDIAANAGINSFGELAESGLSSNFEFNTVLIYYELYDPENPSDSVKNLFGVLFLDNVEPVSGGGGRIPRLEKVKPNPLTGDNGNAYSFKINLKFDVSAEDAAVETTINDYNTFSLELYLDALNELKETTRIFEENTAKLAYIESELNQLKGLVFDTITADQINQRITNLEKQIQESQKVFGDYNAIIQLIDRNYQEILNIYNNQTSLTVAYNLDIIKPGTGIDIDRTSNQFIRISSTYQAFNLTTKPRVSLINDFILSPTNYHFEHQLQNYSNWLKITDGSPGQPFNLDRDVILYIKDYPNRWKAGQRFRISFTYGLNMSNTNGDFNFLIYTDVNDTLNTGFAYSAEVAVIGYEEFTAKNGKPIIEIICIDPMTFDFDFDIF